MGNETGHTSHLCERAPADTSHTMCHNLFQLPAHTHTHQTHTDYSHWHSFVCTVEWVGGGLKEVEFLSLELMHTHTPTSQVIALSNSHPADAQQHTNCRLSANTLTPVETNPSSSLLFSMQGINCLHDELQSSQQCPCDVYTRVVYKHRCGRIISEFARASSRESSFIFALMSHANFILAKARSAGIGAEWVSARTRDDWFRWNDSGNNFQTWC